MTGVHILKIFTENIIEINFLCLLFIINQKIKFYYKILFILLRFAKKITNMK